VNKIAMIAAGFAMSASAFAAEPLDCPFRDDQLSAKSPLIDILLNEDAWDVVNKNFPGALDGMPDLMKSTNAPSFAAILSLSGLQNMGPVDPAAIEKSDKALGKIKINDHDKALRCGRYDSEIVDLPDSDAPLRILVFEKVNGYMHHGALDGAREMVEKIAGRKGWQVFASSYGGAMRPETLAKVDVVVWNNNSGDVLTLSQRQAFRDWIEAGGGVVALHGAGGDPQYWWDWYADELIGARFIGHPMDPQFQEATVTLENNESALTDGVAPQWTLLEEWYSFASSPRDHGANIVATIDESQYQLKGWGGADIAMGADHPIAWTRCLGDGRSFYSAIGHRPENYADANYMKLVENALLWAGGKGATVCSDGEETEAK